MKKTLFLLGCTLLALGTRAQSPIPSAENQIKAAVLAAPADKRAGATVYGYTKNQDLVLLRKGSNEFICLGDNPGIKGFSASCYHKDLEPFMARGRELKKQGQASQQIFDTREKEVKAGTLKMPSQPTTLFVFSAPEENLNPATGEVKGGNLRYVVYIPFATAESTGLPLKPEAPGMPWIMHPGTHGAHIMITPPPPAASAK